MKIRELYEQVAQLGFETSLEDNYSFYNSANRALLQINAIRPITCTHAINHTPFKNLISGNTFEHQMKTEDLTFEAQKARSFYFETDGNGIAYIEMFDEENSKWQMINEISWSSIGKFQAHRGFIKHDGKFIDSLVRIRFTGDYVYCVKNVAMYQFIYSDVEAHIPAYEPFTEYDMNLLVDDFFGFCEPPVTYNEEAIDDYKIEFRSKIFLPYEKNGIYKIIYKHKPNEIIVNAEPNEDEATIDLDEELASLMPLLVAVYIWTDDEPEKSQYYLSLYRERAMEIQSRHKDIRPIIVSDTNGW